MADLSNLSTWKDKFPKRQHVQPNEHDRTVEGAFLSGESAVLVSGPPKFDGGGVTDLIPIGLVQQAQVSQNKQLNQVFEIGGRVPFYIPARVTVNASLSRVIFDGPSLFYALYRQGGAGDADSTIPSYSSFQSGTSTDYNTPTAPYPTGSDQDTGRVTVTDDEGQTSADPGFFWANLASSIFNKPLGLGFVLYDMEGEPYGGVYLEECYVRSHNFGISANQTVLAENVSMAATRIRPLRAENLISSS